MTLDDVTAAMRARFTPRQGGQVVTEAKITAEEWATLASAVYMRDTIEAIVADPTPEKIELARVEAVKSRSDNATRTRIVAMALPPVAPVVVAPKAPKAARKAKR